MKHSRKPHITAIPLPEFPLWKKVQERRTLMQIALELTVRCNHDCRHCYACLPANDNARNCEMSLERICGHGDDAVELGALWCVLTGGEPLLRPDFADIYLALKSKGLLLSVYTNASLVRKEHIDLFRSFPPRDVEITVYGISAETYERITRVPGSYAAFRRGLDLLLDAGIAVTLKAMAMKSNFEELPEIVEFCRAINGERFRLDPFLELRHDGMTGRNPDIRSERLTGDEIVRAELADTTKREYMREECRELLMPQRGESGQLFFCQAGCASCYLTYDGRFLLCPSLRHPDCIYDLTKGSLRDAWTEFAPQVRAMQSDAAEYMEKCRKCSIINFCQWCPATAWLETGRLDMPVEEFCRIAYRRVAGIGDDDGA